MASAEYFPDVPQSFSGIAFEEDSSTYDSNANKDVPPTEYDDSMSLSSAVPLDVALMAMDTDLVLDSLHKSARKRKMDLEVTYSGSAEEDFNDQNPYRRSDSYGDLHTLDSQFTDDDGMEGEIHLLCRATTSLRDMLESKSIHCDFETDSCFSDLDSVALLEKGQSSAPVDATATTRKLHPVVDELLKMCEDVLNSFFQNKLIQSKPVQDGLYTIKTRPGETLKTAFAIYVVVKGVSFLTRIA